MPGFYPLPEGVFEKSAHAGTLERVDYAVDRENGPLEEKHCWVYLPYGYDPMRPYDILYFLHGGGEDADGMFFTKDDAIPDFAALLDHMIEKNVIRPILAVTPTYYSPDHTGHVIADAAEAVARFPDELFRALIPAVEGRYGPGRDFSPAGLISSAKHRALGGFSMGSVATWYCFLYDPRRFGAYLPLSGDCWACGMTAGSTHPDETAEALEAALAAVPPDEQSFYIYAATGTDDIACPNMDGHLEAMRRHAAGFVFAPREAGGNISYERHPGGVHNYACIYQYLYNLLPRVFPAD